MFFGCISACLLVSLGCSIQAMFLDCKLTAELMIQLAIPAVEKNIDISLNSEKDIIINANSTSIGILMRNLIDNAIRYTPKEGQVTVDVTTEGQEAIFRVTDNGPGIPPELRARVFERFFRTLGTKATGSGLGLAIVQQIASLYNGYHYLRLPSPQAKD